LIDAMAKGSFGPMNHECKAGSRLTFETALWIVVVAIALGLRLAQLEAAPLAAPEAREAMLAWRAATGQGFPATNYNPLLLAANGLLFTLFGTSDFRARLLPALFGALLALSPSLFRQHLGRVGALAAGLYLAISPTALVVSRQLAGTAIASTGAMASVGGAVRFFETKDRRWLTLSAVGLALAVTGGATAYALLLPLGMAWILLSQLWLDGQYLGLRQSVFGLRPYARQFFLTFTLALLALCTGLGWNLSGVGAVGDLFVDWLRRFRPGVSSVASPLTLLVTYELFALVFGIGGLLWALRAEREFAALLGLWAGLEVSLLALMPSPMPTDLLWAVLPLAFLAGMVVDLLARDWSPADVALRAAYAAFVLVLWAYGYLMLGRYAALGDRADLGLAVIAVVVQVLLGLSFGWALGPASTLRTAATATGFALLALTLSAGWGVAYEHPADPREALLSEPTAIGVRDLVLTLRDISWAQTGMPTTLEFVFQAPQNSVLAWYLRGFEMAHRVDRLGGIDTYDVEILVLPAGRDQAESAPVGAEYTGQDFALRGQWVPSALGCRFWDAGCNAAVGWFLFREEPLLPEAVEWATLWRRLDAMSGD
jgi:uncharacterized protein (TIGR03663 family)